MAGKNLHAHSEIVMVISSGAVIDCKEYPGGKHVSSNRTSEDLCKTFEKKCFLSETKRQVLIPEIDILHLIGSRDGT